MELFSKDAVINEIRWVLGSKYFSDNNRDTISEILLNRIEYIPTTDGIVHAKWISLNNGIYECSKCKFSNDFPDNFCPHCGAKMDVEED